MAHQKNQGVTVNAVAPFFMPGARGCKFSPLTWGNERHGTRATRGQRPKKDRDITGERRIKRNEKNRCDIKIMF